MTTEVTARYFAIQYDGTNGQEVAEAFGLPLSTDAGTHMDLSWAYGVHRVNANEWLVWRDYGSYKDLQGIITDEAYQAAYAPVDTGP
jgi:hypothetical protein